MVPEKSREPARVRFAVPASAMRSSGRSVERFQQHREKCGQWTAQFRPGLLAQVLDRVRGLDEQQASQCVIDVLAHVVDVLIVNGRG